MTKKRIYIIGGLLVVSGIGFYLYSKKKKQAAQKQAEIDNAKIIQEQIAEESRLESEKKKAEAVKIAEEKRLETERIKAEDDKCLRIGVIRTTPQHQWVSIGSSFRTLANSLSIGSKVTIKRTEESLDGNYTVLDVWKDKNGNIGAIDVPHNFITDKKEDNKYQGLGLICLNGNGDNE